MRLFNKIRVKFKCFMKKHRLMKQFCKKCGKSDEFDYSVSEKDWGKLPIKYQNHVLCLNCFMEEYPESEVEMTLYLIK